VRVETKPFGIDVVVIQPGAIESEWSAIAADNLRKTSSDSVYQHVIGPTARALEDYDKAAGPGVVVKAVSRAVNSSRPRRRYATPLDAKALIFLHWLLPDSLFERLLKAALR